jgi:cytochrome c553
MRQLPRRHQGLSASRQGCAGGLQDLPRRPGDQLSRQRSRRQQRASVHQLPRRCARIFPKDDARSAVYPLNVPKTCGQCHGNNGMAGKHGLASVYPNYIDSIHGFALSKEGLLVAANCQSCHGSHHILSHTDPAEPDLQGQHSQDLRQLPRQDQCRLPGGVHGKAVAGAI